jgi:hypothetical protein
MAVPLGALLNAEYPAGELIELGRLCESLGYGQLWHGGPEVVSANAMSGWPPSLDRPR